MKVGDIIELGMNERPHKIIAILDPPKKRYKLLKMSRRKWAKVVLLEKVD